MPTHIYKALSECMASLPRETDASDVLTAFVFLTGDAMAQTTGQEVDREFALDVCSRITAAYLFNCMGHQAPANITLN